jgi:hypothetical protein
MFTSAYPPTDGYALVAARGRAELVHLRQLGTQMPSTKSLMTAGPHTITA